MTAPVTNDHFKSRVSKLIKDHLSSLEKSGRTASSTETSKLPEPVLPPLTPKDTSLLPGAAVQTYIARISPWIDLSSKNPVVSSISRQVLNLELNYANFCGCRSVMLAGPARDASPAGGNLGLAQYSRAVQEALTIGSRLNIVIHTPMYREPGMESESQTLSFDGESVEPNDSKDVDLFSTWDSWHHVRSFCEYNTRLVLGKISNRV